MADSLGFDLQYEGVYAPNISNFQTSSIQYDNGSFNWQNDPDDTGDADAYNWVIEYGGHGFIKGYGKQATIPSGTFVAYLNNLLPMTNYDFYGYADAGNGAAGNSIMLNVMTPAPAEGTDYELHKLQILDELSFEKDAYVGGKVYKFNSITNKASLTILSSSVLFGYADVIDGQILVITGSSTISSTTNVNNTIETKQKLTSSILKVASAATMNSTLSSNATEFRSLSTANTLTGSNGLITANSFVGAAKVNSDVNLNNLTSLNNIVADSAVNINGNATYVSGTSQLSVASKLSDIDTAIASRKSALNANYADTRYCAKSLFDANGDISFTLPAGKFPYSDLSNLSVDIMTKANGETDYKNELLSYRITNDSGDAKVVVSSPSMGTSDYCRLVIVNNKQNLL